MFRTVMNRLEGLGVRYLAPHRWGEVPFILAVAAGALCAAWAALGRGPWGWIAALPLALVGLWCVAMVFQFIVIKVVRRLLPRRGDKSLDARWRG